MGTDPVQRQGNERKDNGMVRINGEETDAAGQTVAAHPDFATSFFEKCGLSQCSRGSREKTAIIL